MRLLPFNLFGASRARSRRSSRPRRRGFTLIEAALTTVIVGVGTVGIIELLATGTVANTSAGDQTIAVTLAKNIREMMSSPAIQFADPNNPTHWGLEAGHTIYTAQYVDEFDGAVFTPAVDSRRQKIDYLTGWSQSIKVDTVDPTNITHVIPHGTTPADQRPVSRVTVTVFHGTAPVCQTSWLQVYIGL